MPRSLKCVALNYGKLTSNRSSQINSVTEADRSWQPVERKFKVPKHVVWHIESLSYSSIWFDIL
jgi:hypothetical protein